MISKYHIGDTVTTGGSETRTVVGITILYKLDNGRQVEENQLTIAKKAYSDDAIIYELCEAIDTTRETLISSTNKINGTYKRQAITYILRKRFGWGYTRIQSILKRNHSTHVHSVRAVQDLLDVKDKLFVEMIQKLDEKVKHIYQN